MNNFWQIINNKSQPEIKQLLTEKLGTPAEQDKKANYWLNEISRRLYYGFRNNPEKAISKYSTIQAKIIRVEERAFKKGTDIGETYYTAITEMGQKFHIMKEVIQNEKVWKEAKEATCLNKTYLIKYYKWIRVWKIVDWNEVN